MPRPQCLCAFTDTSFTIKLACLVSTWIRQAHHILVELEFPGADLGGIYILNKFQVIPDVFGNQCFKG